MFFDERVLQVWSWYNAGLLTPEECQQRLARLYLEDNKLRRIQMKRKISRIIGLSGTGFLLVMAITIAML